MMLLRGLLYASIAVLPVVAGAGGQPVPVKISQVYTEGSSISGAAYGNDYVELFNPTSLPASMFGWSLQRSIPGGTSWSVVNLPNRTIPPGGYFLIQMTQISGGNPLPT